MHVSVSIDEDAQRAMQSMPKNMSASRVLRHIMRAFSYSDGEWSEYAKTTECRELHSFLKPYKRRLGLE